MATGTSVLKLVVDDKEYLPSIKNAKQGMQALQESLKNAGKSFTDVDGKITEYIREIGKMETTNKTAKGSINEMSAAFVELSKQYQQLSDQEKQSAPGKALAQSLSDLRERTVQAKDELSNITRQLEPVNNSTRETGGIMGVLSEKLTLNIDALKLFNAGVTAAKAALDVAKDAFFASEANVDEWGRTVAAAKGVYEGFLASINNGDISGFLSNIDQIVQAARNAYNELDKLNTMKTIQAPQFSRQEAENNRLRTMIMTGRWISASDGRRSPLGLKDGDLLSPAQIRKLEQQLQGGMNKIVSLTKTELQQTGKAVDAYYNSLAKQNGMSLAEFRKGTSSWDAFSQKMAGYEAYRKWNANAQAEFARQGGRGRVDFDKNNPYAEYRNWGTFRVDKMGQNSYNELVGLIKQGQQQANQMYSTMGQAYRTMNRAEGISVRNIMGGGSGGGGRRGGGRGGTTVTTYAEGSIAEQEEKVKMLTKAWREATAELRDGYKQQLDEAKAKLDEMVNTTEKPDLRKMDLSTLPGGVLGKYDPTAAIGKGVDALTPLENKLKQLTEEQEKFGRVSAEAWQKYQVQIEDTQNQIDEFKGKNKKVGKDTESSWDKAASAIQSVGGALQSLEDPSARIVGIVAEAIANIALAFSKADLKDGASGNVYAWIAATASGLATMVATISAIKSATKYADGGIIQGNSYSGDNIMAQGPNGGLIGLNAGEVVLNRAQTQSLAQSLGNAGGNVHVTGEVNGESIVLVANRFLRRSGKGELVTWK